MEQRYIFSGHESFPSKSLWLKKGYDFVVQEKTLATHYSICCHFGKRLMSLTGQNYMIWILN